MCTYAPNFEAGDIIEFCGDQFVVLENYGNAGKVEENYPNGAIIKLHWEFQDTKCNLVENGVDNRK